MVKRKKYIIANWKMNPLTLREAKKLFTEIKKAGNRAKSVETIVCPPFLFVSELQERITGRKVSVGAQDAFPERTGAFTGYVSAAQLRKAEAGYVILGHSERRARGETNEDVNKKIKAVLKEHMRPIICIGEKERDEAGEYLHTIESQLKETLTGIGKERANKLIITYEPVWAISNRKGSHEDSPEDTEQTVLYIRKVLAKQFGRKGAFSMPILYGGSANPQNAEGFLEHGGVDGLLVGSASLDGKSFSEIIKAADAL